MKVEHKLYSVEQLIRLFDKKVLSRNEEYQRGEAWTKIQKAGFIDSIFRNYPVPAIFVHDQSEDMGGGMISTDLQIVDGQQRIMALSGFKSGKFPLLSVAAESKLRVPNAIREIDAPWAGKMFEELQEELKSRFLNTSIFVFVIASDSMPEEVRDLFIRLQSGTALSRQQVRDAWPGNLGPFVESLAGKLDRSPSSKLFQIIDRRGTSNEEEDQKDRFVTDRQVCAQLLKIFLARESDPNVFPSVSANELDSLYHEYTDFDRSGPSAQKFMRLLSWATQVFDEIDVVKGKKGAKVRRLEVAAVLMYLQDVTRNSGFKFNREVARQLARNISEADRTGEPVGKKTSGPTLQKYYTWWRESIAQETGIYLDPNRSFSSEQKEQIWKRDAGHCQVCGESVLESEEEYDHFPVPHRDGGKTVVENGRLVHATCHPRGRPLKE